MSRPYLWTVIVRYFTASSLNDIFYRRLHLQCLGYKLLWRALFPYYQFTSSSHACKGLLYLSVSVSFCLIFNPFLQFLLLLCPSHLFFWSPCVQTHLLACQKVNRQKSTANKQTAFNYFAVMQTNTISSTRFTHQRLGEVLMAGGS